MSYKKVLLILPLICLLMAVCYKAGERSALRKYQIIPFQNKAASDSEQSIADEDAECAEFFRNLNRVNQGVRIGPFILSYNDDFSLYSFGKTNGQETHTLISELEHADKNVTTLSYKGDRFDVILFIDHGKKDSQVRSFILDSNDNIYKDSDGDGKLDSINIKDI